jgi:hypothetical protein
VGEPGRKVPGIVLLHGGGGTAFESWVKLWVDRGYAAIAIDTSQITSGTIADARLPTKGTAGTYANSAYVPVITTDAYGRVTNVTNTAIAIAASAVTGSFSVSQGGTGVTSFTANSVLISGTTSTSAVVSLNSSTEGHVLQISSTGVPTFAHLNGGSF